MNRFQRLKDILIALILTAFGVTLILVPEEGYNDVILVLSLLIAVYGIRLLWYYITMSRHMVGGKSSLYHAVIVLDLALFTGSIATMNNFIILFYLLGSFAFGGVINVLRSLEAKRYGASWRFKFFSGVISVVFAIAMLVLAIVLGNNNILVYGFSISLFYSAAVRIYNAFRKTAIVYIQ